MITWQDRRGSAALEFGLIAPILFTVMFGIAEVGIVLNQYATLTQATIVGAMQLAFSAGVDGSPYTNTVSAIQSAAPNLTPLTIVLSVNGTACGNDTACRTALAGGTGFVTVTTTYSCAAINIVFDLLPDCSLTARQTERVQ